VIGAFRNSSISDRRDCLHKSGEAGDTMTAFRGTDAAT